LIRLEILEDRSDDTITNTTKTVAFRPCIS